MRELFEILQRICELAEEKQPAALATVVETSGSTYRRPGARMLISSEDNIGAVSPGCLEDEVIAAARNVIESGNPELMSFDTTEEMDAIIGTGLGCRGVVNVFIEALHPDSDNIPRYQKLHDVLDNGCSAAFGLVTTSTNEKIEAGTGWVISHDEVREESDLFWASDYANLSSRRKYCSKNYALEQGNINIFVERIDPRERMAIFGAGFDAQPLVEMAAHMGLHTTLVDHRSEYLLEERFPKTSERVLLHPADLSKTTKLRHHDYIVIMTHNYLNDLKILNYALSSDASYVGQIGPKDRTQELITEIEKERGPFQAETLSKLHAPIGLDIGAETPEEIAISIMSEILAFRSGRRGQSLRDRDHPIHDA